jgi:hypothetical protein
VIEIVIASEKGRAGKVVKPGHNVVSIFHSRTADFNADLSKVNLPTIQALSLVTINILVQDVHAARRRFPVFSIKASRANSTASAMASWPTLPNHALEI